MKTTVVSILLITTLALFPPPSQADTFGSGLNTFDIDFVTIGDPENTGDTMGSPNPVGRVDYKYRIGQFEISEEMIDKANAEGGYSITHDNRGAEKAATSISWFEAAQFVNWLNINVGSTPAYKFDGNGDFQLWAPGDIGYNSNNVYRNTQAKYFLPSVDEWYKAAYYDPAGGVYYDYPTGSNTVPDGIDFAGDSNFDAVFYDGSLNPGGPNNVTNVGVPSPYGTEGQGGNVWEWEETSYYSSNMSSSSRGRRGGGWGHLSDILLSSYRNNGYPSNEYSYVGFRVASVPEPSTLLLGAMATVGLLLQRRRRSKPSALPLYPFAK